jgi:hypothetical protein
MSTFASGLGASGSVADGSPVLYSGNGGTNANSLWNIVDNNGSKHRD